MRRPNCLFSSRCIRSALHQQETTLNRATNVNFSTLKNVKLVTSAKQVKKFNKIEYEETIHIYKNTLA